MNKVIAALMAVLVALAGVLTWHVVQPAALLEISTPYQAVVLTGGQVYYGKLENATGMYPVLRDVFYIATQTNTATGVTSSVMVRRGKELHGPTHMVLSRTSILFIEPVSEDSQVAKFIAEQHPPKP